MTRKQTRATMIAVLLGGLAVATGLVLWALSGTIVYFYSPTDLVERHIAPGQRVRIGGLVEKGSLKHDEDQRIEFSVTDLAKSLKVTYQGVLPDLFREGQGVIAEGALGSDGQFKADSVLAKHDEKYMPPEVARALKDKGVWRGADAGGNKNQ
jgi:cytochrome c-type biogenesis protein CcmE